MSAGKFNLQKYEVNTGEICPIRVQPETTQLTLNGVINAQAAGSQTQGYPRATVSGSRRRNGVHARTVTIVFLTTPSAGGYAEGGSVTLPVFQKTVWEGYSDGNEGTYLGANVRFSYKTAEKIK